MRLVKWALGLGILLVLVISLASPVAKWGVQHWLEQQGYQAEIRRLKINLFTGRITLMGVNVRSFQGEAISIFETLLDLRWLPLFERRLVLNQVFVKGLEADAQFDGQGLQLAGRTLSQWWPLGPGSTWSVAVDYGRLDDLTLCGNHRSQCLRVESVALTQGAWTNNEGVGRQFEHRGPLVVERAYVRDQARNSALMYLGQLRIERAHYSPERANLDRVQVNNFHFLENSLAGNAALEAPYLSQIGELTLSDLTLDARTARIQVGTVEVTSWRQLLHREQNQPVSLPWQVRDLLPQDYPGPLGILWRSEGREWVVNSVDLRSGILSWHDTSVVPTAQARLNRIQVRLGTIDQTLPDNATSVFVAGRFGEKGRLEWQGEIYPFRESVDLDMSGFVHDLELAPFAGYTEALFNQRVSSGLVDASAQVTVRQEQLQAQSRWRLTDWRVASGGQTGRGMPLGQALARLHDHNRAVEFDMPISGHLDDSSFTFNYVFGTVMRQTLSERARRVGSVDESPVAGDLAQAP